MTTVTATDLLAAQSLAQLATLYNTYAPKEVSKFKDKPTAVKRIIALADTLGWTVQAVETGSGVDLVAPTPVVVTPPATERATVEELVTALTPVATSDKRRGPAPRFEDSDVIETVAENPRRKGCKSFERYALYTPGMTVGDYLTAANAKFGTATKDRDFWRVDVRWDADAGHITVKKAG